MVDAEETKRFKAKNLRYKKPIAKDLNLEAIKQDLWDMQEACEDVHWFTDSEDGNDSLVNALLGDEDESYVLYGCLVVNAWMPLPKPYRESEEVKDYEAVKEAVDNTPIAFDTDRVRAVELMGGGRVKKVVEKKILPEYFRSVVEGTKNFEIREDEDNLQICDVLILREWDGEKYTGREIAKNIDYVLRNIPEYGLMPGYVIFGW